MAVPAGRLMERIGYKKGILGGVMCATGALLFIPAACVFSPSIGHKNSPNKVFRFSGSLLLPTQGSLSPVLEHTVN